MGFFHFHLLWTAAGTRRRVPGARSLPFLLLLRDDVGAAVSSSSLSGATRSGVRAALKFFIYTQAGGPADAGGDSRPLFVHGRATGVYTFDYLQLLGTASRRGRRFWLMLGFFLAFAVKLPAMPLHRVVAGRAYTQAPTAGSVILAGLLIKVGAYGMLRFMFPLFPNASFSFATVGHGLGCGRHPLRGLSGLRAARSQAAGRLHQRQPHGVRALGHIRLEPDGSAGSGAADRLPRLQHRRSLRSWRFPGGDGSDPRDLSKMGGLWSAWPRSSGERRLFLAMAALGLPGLGNFVAEFLILLGPSGSTRRSRSSRLSAWSSRPSTRCG